MAADKSEPVGAAATPQTAIAEAGASAIFGREPPDLRTIWPGFHTG